MTSSYLLEWGVVRRAAGVPEDGFDKELVW